MSIIASVSGNLVAITSPSQYESSMRVVQELKRRNAVID